MTPYLTLTIMLITFGMALGYLFSAAPSFRCIQTGGEYLISADRSDCVYTRASGMSSD